MKKRFFAVVFLLMIAATAVVSAKIDDLVITHIGTEKVPQGGTAEFTVYVYNSGSDKMLLNINRDPFVTLPSSWFEQVMFEPNMLEIAGGESKEVKVSIKFKRTTPTDESYKTFLSFSILGDPSKSVEHNFIIRVVPPEELLDISLDAQETVQPGKDYTFILQLKNNLNVLLSEVEVLVSSELFEDKRAMKLLPLQERSEEFRFKIPSEAKPSSNSLNVRVYYDKQLVAKQTTTFFVSTISDISEETESGKTFMKWWKKVVKHNKGNAAVEESISMPLTRFQRLFASYSIPPSSIDNEARWDFTLNPNSSYEVILTVSYRPLFWAIVVVLSFAVVTTYMLTRSVSVKKGLLKLKTTHEGFTHLKIMLHIKNHTAHSLKDVVLIDILPYYLHPTMHFETLRPEKIQRGERGIRLLWEIPEITKHEERIITYSIETKLGVIGNFKLQPALIRYKTKAGKIASARSNIVEFSSGKHDIKPTKEHKGL